MKHVSGCRPPRGFTLIELLVTLAIVAVLALFTVPVAEVAVQRGTESELRHALREIRDALDAYKRAADEGRIQRTLQGSGYPPSLQVLVDGVDDLKDPKRRKLYFLRRVPRNPLDVDSDKEASETWGKRSYASEAKDPQEGDDVFDVYAPSKGIGLNGIPYRQW